MAHGRRDARQEALPIPGLTTLRDYFYENGSEYVVFDYIQGYRLGEVMALRHRPFLEAQAVDVAVKIGVILAETGPASLLGNWELRSRLSLMH